MSRFAEWWDGVCARHERHVRLFHETQHSIIRDKIERDPQHLLERVRELERELEARK